MIGGRDTAAGPLSRGGARMGFETPAFVCGFGGAPQPERINRPRCR